MGLSENGLIISDYTNTVAIPTDLNRPAAHANVFEAICAMSLAGFHRGMGKIYGTYGKMMG